MRRSLVGAAGTAVVITGVTAAVAVGQTAQPTAPYNPYNPPTTTTPPTTTPPTTPPATDCSSPIGQARQARDEARRILSKRAYGRSLRRGSSRTVRIADSCPGTYTIRITRRGGNTSTVRGKDALEGDTAGTLGVDVKATRSGRRYLRRSNPKYRTLTLRVSFKPKGVKTVTSNRSIRMRFR